MEHIDSRGCGSRRDRFPDARWERPDRCAGRLSESQARFDASQYDSVVVLDQKVAPLSQAQPPLSKGVRRR